ncbi:hypothetical protein L7F22_049294 [Adiantum nelumboides]|nr:hypothetical protein [Adiantum nelumboides]
MTRECPLDLKEAVASLIFAAPRASDLPELLEVQTLFSFKYGREFVASAAELRPDCGVNRMIIEKLSARAPTPRVKLDLMQEIAEEFNVDWDSTIAELELSKTQEDLLDGPNEFIGPIQMSPIPCIEGDSHMQDSTSTSLQKGEEVVLPSPHAHTEAADPNEEPKFVPFGVPRPQYGMEALPNRFYSPPRESSITQQSGLLEETLSQRSRSRTKSEGSMNLQDMIEAAEAAAESAEKAARAARQAAELCRSQIPATSEGTSHGHTIPQSTNVDLKGGPVVDDYDWTQEHKGEEQQKYSKLESERVDNNAADDYDWTQAFKGEIQQPTSNLHSEKFNNNGYGYDWAVVSHTKKPEVDFAFSSHGLTDAFTWENPVSGLRTEAENIFTSFNSFPRGHNEHEHRPVYDSPQFDDSDMVTTSEIFRRQASLGDDAYHPYPSLFSKSSSG